MEGYEGPATEYAHAEAKREVEPLREVLARGVTRIEKELEMLFARISPVLRMDEPHSDRAELAQVQPHSSELANQVYALHRLADQISSIARRVEL